MTVEERATADPAPLPGDIDLGSDPGWAPNDLRGTVRVTVDGGTMSADAARGVSVDASAGVEFDWGMWVGVGLARGA
jgi:hypothetical protein